MKVRVITNRRGIHVHGLYCDEHGRGEEEIAEASSAIEVVEILAKKVAEVQFYPCATFGKPSDVTPPRISRRDSIAVKVDTISTWAEENDWDVTDTGAVIILHRDSGATEAIRLTFDGNRFVPKESGYTCGSLIELLPDLDVVMLRISGDPGAPMSAARRRKANLPWARDSTDEEIVDFLIAHGAKVTWINSVTGGEEQAVVPMMMLDEKGIEFGSKQTKIGMSKSGRRILTFCDGLGGGYRSVCIDQILEVA